jgi:hypothetical protein
MIRTTANITPTTHTQLVDPDSGDRLYANGMMADIFPIGCFGSNDGAEVGAVLWAVVGKKLMNEIIKSLVARLIKEGYLVPDPVIIVYGSVPAECCESLKAASMRVKVVPLPPRATPLANPLATPLATPLPSTPTMSPLLLPQTSLQNPSPLPLGATSDLSQMSEDELLANVDVHIVCHPYYIGTWAKHVCQEVFMEAKMDDLDAGTCVCVDDFGCRMVAVE